MRDFDKVMAAVTWQVPTGHPDRLAFEKQAMLLIGKYQKAKTEDDKEACWAEGVSVLSFFFRLNEEPWAKLISQIYRGDVDYNLYLSNVAEV